MCVIFSKVGDGRTKPCPICGDKMELVEEIPQTPDDDAQDDAFVCTSCGTSSALDEDVVLIHPDTVKR